jgi:streptogramin lyase
VEIEIATNQAGASFPVEGALPDDALFPFQPNRFVAGAGALWITDAFNNLVLRIDPDTHAVQASAPNAVMQPVGFAVSGDAAWAVSRDRGEILRIDPATVEVVAVIKVEPAPGEVAVGQNAVWVTNADQGVLLRIDPATNAVVATIPFPTHSGSVTRPALVVEIGGSVWCSTFETSELYRIDATTNEITGRLRVGEIWGPVELDGSLWFAETISKAVIRLDPAP